MSHRAKIAEQPLGFGQRNPHCSNCGDERGGPFGHETSECRYRSGMLAFEVAELLPEHRRGEFWDQAIDRYLSEKLAESRPSAPSTLEDSREQR